MLAVSARRRCNHALSSASNEQGKTANHIDSSASQKEVGGKIDLEIQMRFSQLHCYCITHSALTRCSTFRHESRPICTDSIGLHVLRKHKA